MGTLVLDADNLGHKWGFGDGDTITNWWWANYEEEPPVNMHDVLGILVDKYLVPEIEKAGHEVEIVRIETNHNPIRIETLNGERLNWLSNKWEVFYPTISVSITPEQILDVVDSLGGVK